jgi:redox-sensitive bicupin YhaK (pirin superfamily)
MRAVGRRACYRRCDATLQRDGVDRAVACAGVRRRPLVPPVLAARLVAPGPRRRDDPLPAATDGRRGGAVKALVGRTSDLGGGLVVRRVLPQRAQRAVGPFVFFDHFGPVTLPPGAGDVGPHPHIGLATVTYLFDGGFLHRDSLGTVQEIEPGAVNWMSAGRGVVHSERAPAAGAGRARPLHGLQLWVALPRELADGEPTFQHVPRAAIPELRRDGAKVRVLVGDAFAARSPVQAASPTLYLDVALAAGATFVAGALAEEVAVYAASDGLSIGAAELPPATMAVLAPGDVVSCAKDARFAVIGGARIDPVLMWWNFVARDPARLAAAAKRWRDGGFEPVPGDDERVAMPPFSPPRPTPERP